MSEICPTCGLPKDTLCVCENIAKEEEKIRIYGVKRRYGKYITVVEGISKDVDVKKVLKELKTKLACGGTVKKNSIELQGDHKNKVKPILIKLGFPEEKVEIG